MKVTTPQSQHVILFNDVLRRLRRRFSGEPTAFGPLQAILWSASLDVWFRYTSALEFLHLESENVSVLEIGPGFFGLECFLPRRFWEGGTLVQVNIAPWSCMTPVGTELRVSASGLCLPFKDRSFDYVLAMDVLEHVPRESRRAFCEELTRVCREAVLADVPLEGDDDIFQAARYDRAFQEAYEKRFGKGEGNVAEHLQNGHPTPGEVLSYFPGAVLIGTQNARDWLWYVLREKKRVMGLFAGLALRLRGMSDGPPFYSALTVWRRA